MVSQLLVALFLAYLWPSRSRAIALPTSEDASDHAEGGPVAAGWLAPLGRQMPSAGYGSAETVGVDVHRPCCVWWKRTYREGVVGEIKSYGLDHRLALAVAVRHGEGVAR